MSMPLSNSKSQRKTWSDPFPVAGLGGGASFLGIGNGLSNGDVFPDFGAGCL